MTIQKFLLVALIVALIVITHVDQVIAKKRKDGNGKNGKNIPADLFNGNGTTGGVVGPFPGGSGGSNSGSSIITVGGTGATVKAAAEQICISSLGLDQIKSIARNAENTEKQFNTQIKSSDKTTVKLLKCQKLKNKILKNVCQLVAATLAKKNDQIKINTKQVSNNLVSHDKLCKNIDLNQTGGGFGSGGVPFVPGGNPGTNGTFVPGTQFL